MGNSSTVFLYNLEYICKTIHKLFCFSTFVNSYVLLDQCPNTYFKCSNQKCVHDSVVCDGANDCGDFTDESKGCLGNR